MYKGESDAEALLASSRTDPIDAVTIGYGVANWHLYNQRQEAARRVLRQIVEQNAEAGWAGFGYIAAEADLARITPPGR
jgi:hypothetical protein